MYSQVTLQTVQAPMNGFQDYYPLFFSRKIQSRILHPAILISFKDIFTSRFPFYSAIRPISLELTSTSLIKSPKVQELVGAASCVCVLRKQKKKNLEQNRRRFFFFILHILEIRR